MARIDPARWPQISRHLDALLDHDPVAQARELDAVALTDARLADTLRGLIARHATLERDGFLTERVMPSRDVAPLVAAQRVGAYALVRPLGEGGMGAVWLAERRDGRYDGVAAVKFPSLALLGPQGLGRFAREGRILARLSHPAIARLLDAGVTEAGQPYLVLEYVDGQPIDRHCDAHALDTMARIALFLQVLDAVSHAHRNLVLHRDLKPSNILVTGDGHVKLLDFGIAKLIDDDAAAGGTLVTRAAGRAFTPDYAAPEQVQSAQPVTTASDVYALGVLLYVLLGGRHPTHAPGQGQVEHLVAVVERTRLRCPPSRATRRRATPHITGRRRPSSRCAFVATSRTSRRKRCARRLPSATRRSTRSRTTCVATCARSPSSRGATRSRIARRSSCAAIARASRSPHSPRSRCWPDWWGPSARRCARPRRRASPMPTASAPTRRRATRPSSATSRCASSRASTT